MLVPNVFYRDGRAPVAELPEFIDEGTRPKLFERIVPIMAALTPELTMRDADAYLRLLADSPLAADGPIAVTGYCMGARLALLTSRHLPGPGRRRGRLPRRAAGDRRPGQPASGGPAPSPPSCTSGTPTRTRRCRSSRWNAWRKRSPRPAVRHTCEVYSGAHHGFTQADTDTYDRAADERHWAALLDLLKRAL